MYYICDMYTLADRLVDARAKKGISQEKLAELAGVSQSTIGNLESGTRATARRLPQIAAALGVSAIWLAEGTGPRDGAGSANVVLPATEPTLTQEQSEWLRLIEGLTSEQKNIFKQCFVALQPKGKNRVLPEIPVSTSDFAGVPGPAREKQKT
jgi:transcriptional regulator with XRE-family HTH domain